MDTWFTSDWHLGHKNIITYSHRPFRDVAHMNEELIERHNALVKPGDLVYDIGDFSMNEKVVESAMKRLHGRRVLIPGNHDRCYRKHRNYTRWEQQYIAWGFAEVRQAHEIQMAGQSIRIDHMPYVEDERHAQRYAEYRPVDDGRWLIHGHCHSKPDARFRGHQIDVGVDGNAYRPVHCDQVEQWIRENR